jgi:DNA-binding PadR family transcriptional regulator
MCVYYSGATEFWRGRIERRKFMKVEHLLMPFEIFLLFCVETGIDTPYAILTKTGVGVGASSPSLKRLEKQEMLTSTHGPRNRVAYSITAKGDISLRKALNAGPYVYGRPTVRGTFDSLHRLIFFAWLTGKTGETNAALDFSRDEISKKYRRAENEINEDRDFSAPSKFILSPQHEKTTTEYLARVFRFIKAVADSAEARLQMEAIEDLRQLLFHLPPTPRTFLQDPPSEDVSALSVAPPPRD